MKKSDPGFSTKKYSRRPKGIHYAIAQLRSTGLMQWTNFKNERLLIGPVPEIKGSTDLVAANYLVYHSGRIHLEFMTRSDYVTACKETQDSVVTFRQANPKILAIVIERHPRSSNHTQGHNA